MSQEFINERQTSAFRKFKYRQLVDAGIHRALARRIRDWRTPAVIRKIAEAQKKEYAFAHYNFYTALAKAKIEMLRDTLPEPVELSPEEDHENNQ